MLIVNGGLEQEAFGDWKGKKNEMKKAAAEVLLRKGMQESACRWRGKHHDWEDSGCTQTIWFVTEATTWQELLGDVPGEESLGE